MHGLEEELAGGTEVEPPADEPSGTPPPASARTASVPVGPIVLLGVGAASGIASIITGALALGRNDELSATCPQDRCASEDARAIASDVETLSIATDVLWPVALAALAAGAIWLAVDLSSGSEEERALGVGCGPLGCTARFEGTFR